jgi:hypothetical protein
MDTINTNTIVTGIITESRESCEDDGFGTEKEVGENEEDATFSVDVGEMSLKLGDTDVVVFTCGSIIGGGPITGKLVAFGVSGKGKKRITKLINS